jgi:hypothetical protein
MAGVASLRERGVAVLRSRLRARHHLRCWPPGSLFRAGTALPDQPTSLPDGYATSDGFSEVGCESRWSCTPGPAASTVRVSGCKGSDSVSYGSAGFHYRGAGICHGGAGTSYGCAGVAGRRFVSFAFGFLDHVFVYDLPPNDK